MNERIEHGTIVSSKQGNLIVLRPFGQREFDVVRATDLTTLGDQAKGFHVIRSEIGGIIGQVTTETREGEPTKIQQQLRAIIRRMVKQGPEKKIIRVRSGADGIEDLKKPKVRARLGLPPLEKIKINKKL